MAVRSSCIPPVNTIPHQIVVYSTQSTQYHMADQSCTIPPVNTIPHQIVVYSSSQHNTTSDRRVFLQSTQYHIRSSCIPPVNTIPHQIVVYSSSQHNTTSDRSCTSSSQHNTTSDRRVFLQSTHYHIRSSCIPPVNTIPHQIGQTVPFLQSTQYRMAVRLDHSTSQHSTTWRSDGNLVRNEKRSGDQSSARTRLLCKSVDNKGNNSRTYYALGPSLRNINISHLYIQIL